MSPFTIRSAVLTDLNSLVEFENSCFSLDNMSKQSIRRTLIQESAIVLIAEIDSTMVGSATIFFRKNSRKARIYSIAVSSLYHGKGIAAALHEQVEQTAKARKCEYILLEVRLDNPRAIQFYKKNGYQSFAIYKQFYEDKTDALRMIKKL